MLCLVLSLGAVINISQFLRGIFVCFISVPYVYATNTIGTNDKLNIKKYAIYFPQFHEIAENNLNFYPGFTDIVSLNLLPDPKKETPNLKALNLQHILDYDLLKNDALIDTQIDLLEEYDIDGFAMYYYWFSHNTITHNHRIMYNVVSKLLNHNNLRGKKIFYIWANDNWTDHPAFGKTPTKHRIANAYKNHSALIRDLIQDFKNENYLKINNKPLFLVHHPDLIEYQQLQKFKAALNRSCIKHGFDGVELRLNNCFSDENDPKCYRSQPIFDFHRGSNKFYFSNELNVNVLDYGQYVSELQLQPQVSIQSLFFDYDHQARLFKPNRSEYNLVCINNTRENHLRYIEKLKEFYRANPPDEYAMILINAWNEWGERMHIEPSEERGFYYLDLIRDHL